MSKQDKKRILIVDDHAVVRAGLALFIKAEPDLEVCGEAESRSQALAAVETTHPDLVTVDLTLRDSNGLDLIKDLHARYPDLALLVLSVNNERLYAARCLRAGARGYLEKQQVSHEIVQAIRRVLAGDWYFSPEFMQRLTTRAGDGETILTDPLTRLSDRELQVFESVGRGFTTKEIAANLKLDHKTVESYRRRTSQKLGLPKTADFVREAVLRVDAGL